MLAFLFPFVLSLFQVFLEAFFRIPEGGGLFELLALYHFILFVLDIFDLLFEVDDVLGYINILQVHPCAYFIQHVDGFVR